MEVIETPDKMTVWARKHAGLGKKIVLVPTMGYFHEGHLSLMRMAREYGDEVVVSLFVNPIQFGANEDLSRYPSDFDRDAELAEKEGVSILFAPSADQMYPPGFQTAVTVEQLSRHLCGADRPGHFTGVTTVVSKLFLIIRPDYAVFGQKDFQQLAIIRRMAVDMNMGVEILAHPIVREQDGLAMSSRNVYLDRTQRASALSLSKGIGLARKLFQQGVRDTARLGEKVSAFIASYSGTDIDYVGFVDSDTLEFVNDADKNTRLLLAVTLFTKVRLIDNGLLADPS
jgi:pantoate--beta-alanine ligase